MNTRKRKTLLLLLPLFTLFSCDKIELSEDVTRLIYNPTIQEAKEKAKKINAFNTNTIYDGNDSEIGKETYRLTIDRTEFRSSYSYNREDTYSGNRIAIDSQYSTNLFVTKKNTSVSYNENEELYEVTVLLNGYRSDDTTKEEIQVSGGVFKYKQNQFETEIDNKIFYSSEVSSRYTGGYYLADFFKTILAEYKSFTVEDNCLVYTIKDKIYKSSKEQAKVNETLIMNDFGMLVSMDQSAVNTTTNQRSVSSTKVSYN